MVPQSTVRAQYAKHNPPSHAKPWGGPAERAMKAVGLQIWTQTVLSTNRNHCSQEGKWPASEKSDTLLWSEVGRDDLFIYHLFFLLLPPLPLVKNQRQVLRKIIYFASSEHSVRYICIIFVFSWMSTSNVFSYSGRRKQETKRLPWKWCQHWHFLYNTSLGHKLCVGRPTPIPSKEYFTCKMITCMSTTHCVPP